MINESDLAEVKSATLSGVTVGIGSQVLIFSERASIIVQCDYSVDSGVVRNWGHGEQPETSVVLFGFLNLRVLNAIIERDGVLVLAFEGGGSLSLVPERNGMESYVLATRLGVCPVTLD